jgi:hypothetical protein
VACPVISICRHSAIKIPTGCAILFDDLRSAAIPIQFKNSRVLIIEIAGTSPAMTEWG